MLKKECDRCGKSAPITEEGDNPGGWDTVSLRGPRVGTSWSPATSFVRTTRDLCKGCVSALWNDFLSKPPARVERIK